MSFKTFLKYAFGSGKQEWANATSVARAFQLGKLEAEAVHNLRCKVAPPVLNKLSEAVRRRGLSKLLTHDVIAKEVMNINFTSGTGTMEQWQEELRNRDNNHLAPSFYQTIIFFEFLGTRGGLESLCSVLHLRMSQGCTKIVMQRSIYIRG